MFHKWIGTLAGLLAIVAGLVAFSRWGRLERPRDWVTGASVPAWTLIAVAVGAVALVVLFAILLVARRQPWGQGAAASQAVRIEELEEEVERALAQVERTLTEVAVATSYLATIDDFMVGIRRALGKANRPREALKELEPVRTLVFDGVIQGINSARAEHIRCVFFKPRQEERGLVLRPEAHFGHTPAIENLWLWADARSAAGRAFATASTIYIPRGAGEDERVQTVPEQKPMEALLCIPAFGPRSETPIGVFSVDSTRPEAFTRSDREFAGVCASMFALVDFLADIFESVAEPASLQESGPSEALDPPEAG
jgi:hypothetical protein